MSSAQANSKLQRVHKWMNALVATGLNAHILRLHGKKKKTKNKTSHSYCGHLQEMKRAGSR